ncbi:hypothetical protein [Pseudomonas fluorescens]|uniref:Transmembrane protein n=1 Tax=Pseudomonas fluorescens TaxID=294 RepID=A0A5E7FND3_PSEFL|nr:hypothetical protein [Pseudomonas fluorescens]VVO40735.1 hypothetical protein PS833_05800 [Pseudomonas fluorescens]
MFARKFCYVDGAPRIIKSAGYTDGYCIELNGYTYDHVTLDERIHRYLTDHGQGKKTRLYCAYNGSKVNVLAIQTENGETLKTDSIGDLLVGGAIFSLLAGGATMLLSFFPIVLLVGKLHLVKAGTEVEVGMSLALYFSIGITLWSMHGLIKMVRMRNAIEKIPSGSIEKAGKKTFGVNAQAA